MQTQKTQRECSTNTDEEEGQGGRHMMLVLGRGGNRRPNKERGQLLLATPSQYFCRICEMSDTEEIHNTTSYYTPKNLATIIHSTGMVDYSTSLIF